MPKIKITSALFTEKLVFWPSITTNVFHALNIAFPVVFFFFFIFHKNNSRRAFPLVEVIPAEHWVCAWRPEQHPARCTALFRRSSRIILLRLLIPKRVGFHLLFRRLLSAEPKPKTNIRNNGFFFGLMLVFQNLARHFPHVNMILTRDYK